MAIRRRQATAVILLTGHGTLETAMAAIQARAANYLLKPAHPGVIRRTVNEALGYDAKLWEAKELIKRHIFAMRQKLEPAAAHPRPLLNVRAVGYRPAVE